MSSEMYVRWDVQNLENLHRKLKVQLEKEREQQAELFRQMASDISGITNEIYAAKKDAQNNAFIPVASAERVSNISNFDTGEVVVCGSSETIENVQVVSDNRGNRTLVAIDWSNFLNVFESEASDKIKKVKYAKEISLQLATAVLLTDEEIKLQNEFVSYLNGLIQDDELDFEYFKSLIDRRFLALKKVIKIREPQELTEELYEYYALCELTGTQPKAIKKEQVKEESKRLFEIYTEQKKEDYVYENLMEVFAELHMSVIDEMNFNGLLGYHVIDDSIQDCSIFMSIDGGGIVFETLAEVENVENVSFDKKTKIEQSANKICQKHLLVIRKMKERGICLQIEYEQKPNAERIKRIKKNTSRRITRRKKQEKYIEE